MYKSILLALLLACAGAHAAPVPVVLDNFRLHARLANYKVQIPSCATFGERLVSIQLKQVTGRAYADRVILVYADRQTQVVKIGRKFAAGELSPSMDLGIQGFHDSRCLSELFLTAKSGSGNSRIRVLGIVEKTRPLTPNAPR